MKRSYTALHVIAGIIGVAVLGVSIYSNIQGIHGQTNDYADPNILAAIAVAIATAVGLSAAFDAFRKWQTFHIGVLLLIASLVGFGFESTTTLDRTGAQRDAMLSKIWKADIRWAELAKLESMQRTAMVTECTTIDVSTKRSDGPLCKMRKQAVTELGEAREKRELELDGLAQRISAMVPFVSLKNVSLYQPALLPIALLLFSNFLIAYASAGRMVAPEFNTELKGVAALEDKARRFAEAFYASNNRKPKATELAQALGVSPTVARRLARVVA